MQHKPKKYALFKLML